MQYKNKPITGHKEMRVCSRREAWYDGRAFFGILAYFVTSRLSLFPGIQLSMMTCNTSKILCVTNLFSTHA